MNKFSLLYEHYCPKLSKNIVIERRVDDDDEKNICLCSVQCKLKACENSLLDVEVITSQGCC